MHQVKGNFVGERRVSALLLLLQSTQVLSPPAASTASSLLGTRAGRIMAACRGLEMRIESLRHGQSRHHAALQHHAQCTRMEMLLTTLTRVRMAGGSVLEDEGGLAGGRELAANPTLGLEWARGWLEQVSNDDGEEDGSRRRKRRRRRIHKSSNTKKMKKMSFFSSCPSLHGPMSFRVLCFPFLWLSPPSV
jgi:hypothetical protein